MARGRGGTRRIRAARRCPPRCSPAAWRHDLRRITVYDGRPCGQGARAGRHRQAPAGHATAGADDRRGGAAHGPRGRRRLQPALRAAIALKREGTATCHRLTEHCPPSWREAAQQVAADLRRIDWPERGEGLAQPLAQLTLAIALSRVRGPPRRPFSGRSFQSDVSVGRLCLRPNRTPSRLRRHHLSKVSGAATNVQITRRWKSAAHRRSRCFAR